MIVEPLQADYRLASAFLQSVVGVTSEFSLTLWNDSPRRRFRHIRRAYRRAIRDARRLEQVAAEFPSWRWV
jgi:hypothetical protein